MTDTEFEIINACYAAAYAKAATLPGSLSYDAVQHEAHLAAREAAKIAVSRALTNFAMPAALKASHSASVSRKQEWLKQQKDAKS